MQERECFSILRLRLAQVFVGENQLNNQNNSLMITNCEITEIFYLCDEFSKEFEKNAKNYRLKPNTGKKHRNKSNRHRNK